MYLVSFLSSRKARVTVNTLIGDWIESETLSTVHLQEQEAQLMLTTGSTRLAVNQGQQT